MALAPCIKRSLWEAGFSRIQSDGELLKEMWELDIEFKQSLTASISLKGSYSIEEACTMLQTLIDKVEPGTPTQGYSSIQREWALRDRIADKEFQLKVYEETTIKKWRHWKRSRVLDNKSANMRY
jgi:hypothetical protein